MITLYKYIHQPGLSIPYSNNMSVTYMKIFRRKGFQKILLLVTILTITVSCGMAQSSKEIISRNQSWFSINTLSRLSNRWGVMADLHVVRKNFFNSAPRFYFARIGVNYWLKENITFSLGYGHMWLAPSVAGWGTYSEENRIHEQFQVVSKFNKLTVVQRLRNEQRWQEIMVNDKPSGHLRFTNRIRYLASVNIPLFKNKNLPSLALADELMIQFGKAIVYNTFDQNRLFIGVKQRISSSLSFDIGYMRILQQKFSGYQYDLFHTFRLYFYYTPDFRKFLHQQHSHTGDE
jgi:hypothetical protein